MTERMLTLAAVEEITGFKKSYIYREMKAGKFPQAVKRGSTTRWKSNEVESWAIAWFRGELGQGNQPTTASSAGAQANTPRGYMQHEQRYLPRAQAAAQ